MEGTQKTPEVLGQRETTNQFPTETGSTGNDLWVSHGHHRPPISDLSASEFAFLWEGESKRTKRKAVFVFFMGGARLLLELGVG